MADLECDCCTRDATSGQDFLCVSCARSSVYLSRLESTKILLEKENLGKEIEAAARPLSGGSRSANHAQIAWSNEAINAEQFTARARVEDTRSRTKTLRKQMENARDEIAKRKADLIDRRKSLDAIAQVVPARRQVTLSTLEELRDKNTTSFDSMNTRIISAKARVCRQVANLMTLRSRRRIKDGQVIEQYLITGVVLPDLRDINTTRCWDLTAALNSVAHLLVQVTFYLGIRLPSEITLPHRNYPLATINTPANSYLGHKVPFPGSGSISTTPGSPFSSRHETKATHRPRPIFIGSDDKEEKIAKFARKDPLAFNFFVEGISLLAWNVAWLCRTQSFTAGTATWEDICNIGKNLSVLLAPPQSAAMQRVLSDRDARRRQSQSPTPPPPSVQSATNTGAAGPQDGRLGSTSHHTSHTTSLLTFPKNHDNIKGWKLSKYQLISDALKKHLLTEMNNAEWELLEEQEWNDGGEAFDGEGAGAETVFVGGHKEDTGRGRSMNDSQQAQIDADGRDTGTGDQAAAFPRTKKGSGWTKIRGRDN